MFGWLKALFGASPAPPPKPRGRAVLPSARAPAAKPEAAGPAARARLLREAQEIHRAKRKILDALSDEDRAKLVSMAILTFLNQESQTDSPPRKPQRPAS